MNRHSQSLLASSPVEDPKEGREQNSTNGSDAETYAMSKLIVACRGEGRWGSRNEDNSKIDLVFSFEHPWAKHERLTVLAQVKSGRSYGRLIPDGFELKGRAKAQAIRTSHSICLVWVDRKEKRTFWAYINPQSTTRTQQYGHYHEVSPAIQYDLARCMARPYSNGQGASGLHVRHRNTQIVHRRKNVKNRYQRINAIECPVMGTVELTRLGWRHMFRSGRRESHKATSIDLIPYLDRLIKRFPSSHAITASSVFTLRGYTYQVREHLLKYQKLTVTSPDHPCRGHNCCAYVRLLEEIRFPSDWESAVMLRQQISRRVVLKSAYYK